MIQDYLISRSYGECLYNELSPDQRHGFSHKTLIILDPDGVLSSNTSKHMTKLSVRTTPRLLIQSGRPGITFTFLAFERF